MHVLSGIIGIARYTATADLDYLTKSNHLRKIIQSLLFFVSGGIKQRSETTNGRFAELKAGFLRTRNTVDLKTKSSSAPGQGHSRRTG